MRARIAQTKEKVVAEKQPVEVVDKVKARVEFRLSQIEEVSSHKQTSITFYKHDEIDQQAIEKIAEEFTVHVHQSEHYLLYAESWTVSW